MGPPEWRAGNCRLGTGGLCALLCGLAWFSGLLDLPLPHLWQGLGLFWVVASVWVLRSGGIAWLALPRALRWAGGLWILWAAWVALVQARAQGINFMLSVLVLVWAADIGAYFSGRALGGRFFSRKLAPSVSPGKTWEGVCGGALAVLLIALLWVQADGRAAAASPSLYSRLWAQGGPVFVLGLAFLTSMSVVGDLVESLFKRAAGVKDSSQLLPGHGGVLDRVDALLPTLPLAMLLVNGGRAW